MSIVALLGPTNTGKTTHALERMAAHRTGCIGFPLRLLARENYDKLVAEKGAHAVALITGEEKIIPPRARYYLCTVESMPVSEEFEFLAVDEVQLCADPERGHIFTDRILRARGSAETMFMGAETAAPVLKALVKGIEFETRPRFSTLTYTGFKKLTRLPPRSAVVAFSVDDVYAMAEMIRSQRGGTAVVMGALSPRTRNAQVEMYQSGEVDFIVATDAIGMGLNMDIHHVALAGTRKFDGQKLRPLTTAELAQIAGRAGRYKRDGTFGVTGNVKELPSEAVEAIQNHTFPPIKQAYWRNSDLDFKNPKALLNSVERKPDHPILMHGRKADDYLTLRALMKRDDVLARADNPEATHLLWEVCQIPDFRQTLSDAHQGLIAEIFVRLCDGPLSDEWVGRQVNRLEDTRGDVDALMNRLSHIRTWTYIAFKSEWLRRAQDWQGRTREIEDQLSDALHNALMNRFVDRRASALMNAMEDDGAELLAGIKSSGEVVVEGHPVGHLRGFVFKPDQDVKGSAAARAVLGAARKALRSEIQRRLSMLLKAQDEQFSLSAEGQILYQPKAGNPVPGQAVASLRKGESPLAPAIDVPDSDLLSGQDIDQIKAHLQGWLARHIKAALGPLVALGEEDEHLKGAARGIAFQVYEAMGIIPRAQIEGLIADLETEDRRTLRHKGIRLGPILVFMPELNKPAAVELRAILWSLWQDKALPPEIPKAGIVSYKPEKADDPKYFQAIGYPLYSDRAIRIDMLDRVITAVYDSAEGGKFQAQHQMAEWLGCAIEDLYAVLDAMGHVRIQKPEEQTSEKVEVKEGEKPPLDWFYLKKGRAFEKPSKPQKAKKGKPKPKAKPKKKDKPIDPDSPFAVLAQLKDGKS